MELKRYLNNLQKQFVKYNDKESDIYKKVLDKIEALYTNASITTQFVDNPDIPSFVRSNNYIVISYKNKCNKDDIRGLFYYQPLLQTIILLDLYKQNELLVNNKYVELDQLAKTDEIGYDFIKKLIPLQKETINFAFFFLHDNNLLTDNIRRNDEYYKDYSWKRTSDGWPTREIYVFTKNIIKKYNTDSFHEAFAKKIDEDFESVIGPEFKVELTEHHDNPPLTNHIYSLINERAIKSKDAGAYYSMMVELIKLEIEADTITNEYETIQYLKNY